MWASNNGHTEIVKCLLEAKADFNVTDNVRDLFRVFLIYMSLYDKNTL